MKFNILLKTRCLVRTFKVVIECGEVSSTKEQPLAVVTGCDLWRNHDQKNHHEQHQHESFHLGFWTAAEQHSEHKLDSEFQQIYRVVKNSKTPRA